MYDPVVAAGYKQVNGNGTGNGHPHTNGKGSDVETRETVKTH
jgi:hypothetical protein